MNILEEEFTYRSRPKNILQSGLSRSKVLNEVGRTIELGHSPGISCSSGSNYITPQTCESEHFSLSRSSVELSSIKSVKMAEAKVLSGTEISK